MQETKIPDPINISIDEKSFKKGHNYVTIVTDCDTKKVIWVSEGHTKAVKPPKYGDFRFVKVTFL
jgi:transposase